MSTSKSSAYHQLSSLGHHDYKNRPLRLQASALLHLFGISVQRRCPTLVSAKLSEPQKSYPQKIFSRLNITGTRDLSPSGHVRPSILLLWLWPFGQTIQGHQMVQRLSRAKPDCLRRQGRERNQEQLCRHGLRSLYWILQTTKSPTETNTVGGIQVDRWT